MARPWSRRRREIRRRGRRAPGAALILALALAACGDGAARQPAPDAAAAAGGARPPNIVLVVLCSFRHDLVGATVGGAPLTPFLDRLAAEGTVFESAVAAAPWTKPATASLLTGLTPNVHELTDFFGMSQILARRRPRARVLAPAIPTLAETLAAAGWATAARVNNLQAGEFFELTRGFADQRTEHRLSTEAMVADVGSWLADRAARGDRRPFFFMLFTRHTHTPYRPAWADLRAVAGSLPPPRKEDYAAWAARVDAEVRRLVEARAEVPARLRDAWRALYDGEVRAVDRALSALPATLDRAGAGRETVVVVTADHGELFFEQGRVGHGGGLEEPLLRVPLLVWGAGVPRGLRVAAVVRSIDLHPTLLEIAGAPPADSQGESLLPFLGGSPVEPPPRSAFSSDAPRAHAVRVGRHKLVVRADGTRALYDVLADPGESRDLAAGEPELEERLRAELRRWLRQERRRREALGDAVTRRFTRQALDELRSLGYVR
jgi:arylsulfatase A-like enzyme